MKNRLHALRAALAAQSLDGFILPVNDEFLGEYVPDSAKRLEWLTGFSGSAGMAVILKDKAAFFTDGRYTLQAEQQVGADFARFNSGEMAPERWLAETAEAGSVIGYDPFLHTKAALSRYQSKTPGLVWQAVTPNPVDVLWENRPAVPASRPRIQPIELAGESSESKRKRIAADVHKAGAQALILTAPDSIGWLLNIRGSDVPYTPFILAYAILRADASLVWYLDEARVTPELKAHLGPQVTIASPERLSADLAAFKEQTILYDPAASPVWFHWRLTQSRAIVQDITDPCQLPKACKNEAEQQGAIAAHIRDGLAVTRFLCWLSSQHPAALTELEVAAKLESFRAQSPLYLEPSFNTISGSGPNGAIVHYRADEASNRKLDANSLLLLDSGGQYADGTTDITRTVAIGHPSDEMRDRFTRVLRGHIALARARFPVGTTGSQLDTLARHYLWEAGLDYDHGTGHGVGSYLSVHEGPQRISKRGGDAALALGMIVSNEPGYYKTGEYGIRIESLVLVREAGERFLRFDTLTLVPIDRAVIDAGQLSAPAREWLNEYHARVYATHAPHLDEAERGWLRQATAEL